MSGFRLFRLFLFRLSVSPGVPVDTGCGRARHLGRDDRLFPCLLRKKYRIADRTSECLCRRDFACPELNPGGAATLGLSLCEISILQWYSKPVFLF